MKIVRPQLFAILILLLSLILYSGADTAIEELFGADRVQSEVSLRCSKSGFESDGAKSVLDELLSKFKKHELQEDGLVTVYDDGKRLLAFDGDSDAPSDVAFVYAHHMSLFDEDGTLAKMQAGLRAITAGGAKEMTKKMLILVIEGPSTAADYAKAVLEESWATLLDKGDDETSSEIMGQVVVHIVSVTGAVTEIAKDSVYQIVNDPALKSKQLMSILGESKGAARGSSAVTSLKVASNDDLGIDVCKEAVKTAMIWARDGANASLQRLQKAEAAGEFAGFVERLISGAVGKMKEVVNKRPSGASPTALKLAEQEIQRNIFTMLTPIFRRHVQLARQEAAKGFNTAVGDDLELTVNVMDDLNAAKHTAIKRFSTALRQLTPKGAPQSTWSIAHDRQQLVESLDEYIAGRADQFKVQGVLPRGRKPIEVWFHFLANHPFGRDYRQDPLSAGDSPDVPFFDEVAATSKGADLVPPSLARALLESPRGKNATYASPFSRRGSWKRTLTPADSEFTREMLMFPLSIKNPSVPLMAGRNVKKANAAPPQKDPTRALLGPERFIRWDLPPLDQVKANIAEAIDSQPSDHISLKDKILNKLPFFSRGFYSHPPINYGKQYTASLPP